MAPKVVVCHTQQFCGWYLAYKRPPWTNLVVGYLQEPRRQRICILTLNIYGVSGDHPQELLQEHQDVITPEYPRKPCVIISGDLHCMPNDRIEAPSWIGSGTLSCTICVLQGSTGLQYSAFPFSMCLTQDVSRLNAVHTLPWPAYPMSGTPSSIGEGTHWLPDKVRWPTSRNHSVVMPGNPGGFGWHPTRITHLSLFMQWRCREVHEAHSVPEAFFLPCCTTRLLYREVPQ